MTDAFHLPLPAQAPGPVDDLGVYRLLFSAAADGLLLVDAAGGIVLANPAAAQLLGYVADDLIGTPVDALVPDSIRPRHAAYRQAYAQAPRPRPMGTQMELVARRRDGSEVMVEIALSPLQSYGLPYVVVAIRDIGSYPRVKQALQRARHSECLAQLGRMAVDERDPQQLLVRVPELAAQALESDFASVLLLEPGRQEFRVVSRFGDFASVPLGARLPACARSAYAHVLGSGQPLVVADLQREQRFDVPQADLDAGMASLLAVPLSDRGRVTGVLCVRSRAVGRFGDDEMHFLQSMANLLATCLQRAQSEEALSHAQRLESVGQLTGGIAHDFNNLLTVIQGNLQVLEELPALAGHEFGQQLVGAAARAARRGAELTAKLLAFSRRQMLQPTAVDVGALLHSLADMLRRTLDQRIEIRVELSATPGALAVLADPGQLEAALLNIAINARDAMPDGGLLRFSAGPAGVLPATVRRGIDDPSAQDERFLRIAVTDTGSGMPEEVRERAFEPFFTTKQPGRGTGLGLSTVYGFAKQSRGAAAIESAPGAGTTISLYLPRPWEQPVAGDEPAAQAEGLPPGLKVLMVEDDAEVRAVARQFLDALGCEVTPSASAEQALLLLGAEDAAFDLLLTDIALGSGMRGTELARQAQRRFPAMAVLLMSGFSADLLAADQDSPPGWELLQKPYSRGELAQAIARALVAGG